jgi:hypothetical protein
MSLTAYVRYDNRGRLVPGGPIVTSVKPKVGDWVAISEVLVTTTPPNYKLRAFVRYINKASRQSNSNKYVAGSLILQHNEPQGGNWKELYYIRSCDYFDTGAFITTEDGIPIDAENNNNLITDQIYRDGKCKN